MNIKEPIEIAKDVYWVGHNIPDDPFQCHVYLIKNGKDSVLIDPGSKLTYKETRRKIKQLMDINDIKYFICHHQDPDIVGCMQDIFYEVGTKDKYIITHWRIWALLKHYDWNVPLYEIEENACKLKIGEKTLQFISTPYLHSPGAFCTFDEQTQTLFSSDLFGGFTKEFELFAKSANDYFEKMKPFHEHYMPSSAILNHGLDRIEEVEPINLIAPQHGSIIKKEFIKPVIEQLRKLKCGLFSDFRYTRDVEKLSRLKSALDEVLEIIAYQENFFGVANKIIDSINHFYNIDYINAFVVNDKNDKIISINSAKHSISTIEGKKKVENMLNASYYLKNGGIFYKQSTLHQMFNIDEPSYVFPIKDKNHKHYGVCFIAFNTANVSIPKDLEVMTKFEIPISMAVLNERQMFCLEKESQKFYEESIKDQLTGLFNRRYMEMFKELEFKRVKRFNQILSVIMLDIDDFKIVNDAYSHQAGNIVLKEIAKAIKNSIRATDIPIRFGGEEFLLFLPNTDTEGALKVAEKIRTSIENLKTEFADNIITLTISGGIASTMEKANSIDELIEFVDKRLYKAKKSGKNRIVSS